MLSHISQLIGKTLVYVFNELQFELSSRKKVILVLFPSSPLLEYDILLIE